MIALTPGGVDQDLVRLGHRRLTRPLYPFDPDMSTPDLTPRLVTTADPGGSQGLLVRLNIHNRHNGAVGTDS
jgi:hypothetical protein